MTKTNLMVSLIAGLALGAGCATRPHQSLDQNYGMGQDFAAAHADEGALEDAMIYPRHFEHDALNSLGQSKLARIASAAKDGTAPVNLYFDAPAAELTDARKAVVMQFLAEYGLPSERVTLAVGVNPATKDLAMFGAQRLYTKDKREPFKGSEGAKGGDKGEAAPNK
ncbi:MAG TPA: hypothetical protein VGN72_16325 [Tepidisphaeraceae bacterium]|nr:hypothetical protein [Tepidisphaeraceae bacterium]